MQEQCIFCAIANKKAPAEIIFENENFLAFKDIHPMAPIHMLVVPKKHYDSLNEVKDAEAQMLGELLINAKQVAKQLGLAEKGFRLMINTGKDGGQTVPHLHVHILGGKPHLPVQVG